ncbi:MAG: GIY-YIG nuclease family protein [bacterium]|nr:GIY-YIG nuclease family protein [bacterium]
MNTEKTAADRNRKVRAGVVKKKRKIFSVYVLRSAEGRMYIGYSQDVEKRIRQHNAKANRGWTRRFTEWKEIYREEFRTRKQAMQRERELKKIRGTKKYKEMVGI